MKSRNYPFFIFIPRQKNNKKNWDANLEFGEKRQNCENKKVTITIFICFHKKKERKIDRKKIQTQVLQWLFFFLINEWHKKVGQFKHPFLDTKHTVNSYIKANQLKINYIKSKNWEYKTRLHSTLREYKHPVNNLRTFHKW